MKVPHIARLIGLRRSTPLQQQVTAMRICPDCHDRTLVGIGCSAQGHCLQCSRCRRLFADPLPGGIASG